MLEKHAYLKKNKYVRVKQQNVMDKELNQVMELRSKLRNKYRKAKSEKDKKRLFREIKSVILLRLKKQNYYGSLDISQITDNKNFWKTISHLFSNKSYTNSRITVFKNGDTLGEKSKVALTFNDFFRNIVK